MDEQDTEDVVLTVDDLVASILSLGTARGTYLEEYFTDRVSLLRLELGAVEGELSGMDNLFSESVFNGLCGDPFADHRVIEVPGPEAPAWLIQPQREMEDQITDLWERSAHLRTEIASLRRAWLRAVLIGAEPALEYRRTTERRLQQRGLGPRPEPPVVQSYWDPDDY